MAPISQLFLLATIYGGGHASYLSYPTIKISSRATLSCPVSNSIACGNGLPDNFCCNNVSSCTVLASNTTALCCPLGSDCSLLSPIDCNIQKQNVTATPVSSLMTTNLTAQLPKCGTGCCPFGYNCNNGSCRVIRDLNFPSTSIPTRSPTTTAALPSSTVTPPSSFVPFPIGSPIQEDPCNNFPAAAVVAGFFPGMGLGIVLTLGVIYLIGVRRARREARSPDEPFGRVAAHISDPIYNGAHNSTIMRAYPIRKEDKLNSISTAGKSVEKAQPGRSAAIERVRHMFRRSAAAGNGHTNLHDSPTPAPRVRQNVPPVPVLPLPMAQTYTQPSTFKSSDQTPSRLYTPPQIPSQNAQPPRQANTWSRAYSRDVSPVTPRLQREPSSEEINIFAHASTVSPGSRRSLDRQTTFSDMLERANLSGVARGEGYLRAGLEPRRGDSSERVARRRFAEGEI